MSATYKLFACEVLRKEVEHLLDRPEAVGHFDVEFVEMGLHEKPELLNAELKKRIAACAGRGYRAVLLLFGLCSRATAGLEPPADSRLVIPRVHDCISLYLGSARRYLTEQATEAGTYWFSRGFLHRVDGKPIDAAGLGAGLGFSGDIGATGDITAIRQSFVEQYGEDNADYLMETLVESWKKNYRRAVHLEWEHDPDLDADRRFVAEYAARYGWRHEARPVDLRLVKALLGGDWPEDEFVVVLPGQRTAATNDEHALRAEILSS